MWLCASFREMISPVDVMVWSGSRRKLSRMRVGMERLRGVDFEGGGDGEDGGEGEGCLPIVKMMLMWI